MEYNEAVTKRTRTRGGKGLDAGETFQSRSKLEHQARACACAEALLRWQYKARTTLSGLMTRPWCVTAVVQAATLVACRIIRVSHEATGVLSPALA